MSAGELNYIYYPTTSLQQLSSLGPNDLFRVLPSGIAFEKAVKESDMLLAIGGIKDNWLWSYDAGITNAWAYMQLGTIQTHETDKNGYGGVIINSGTIVRASASARLSAFTSNDTVIFKIAYEGGLTDAITLNFTDINSQKDVVTNLNIPVVQGNLIHVRVYVGAGITMDRAWFKFYIQ